MSLLLTQEDLRCPTALTTPVVRAGIYTRTSWDLEGQRAGVERQRVDCETLCTARGWEIAQYFEDNDRSAYTGKKRWAYEQMLAAVDDGALDAIVIWHNDRLHRSPRELEALHRAGRAPQGPGGGGHGRRI